MVQTFKPSEQQTAVIEWGLTGRGHANIKARAGCGKTSTLMMLVEALVPGLMIGESIIVCCFNKSIANKISAKLAKAGYAWNLVSCRTVHSIGFSAWMKVAANCKVVDNKTEDILDAEIGTSEERKLKLEPYRGAILKAVSLAKQRAFGVLCSIDDHKQWFNVIDHFGLDEDLPDDADMEFMVRCCIWLYKKSLKACYEVIDQDDMILAPLYYKIRMWQNKWVMIDEAQDTNAARRALALKVLHPTKGRLVAVGDDAQAIYGFTGADSDSMDLIKQSLNSIELPLNVTYRSARSIVALAQTWVPDITAAPGAPEGIIRSIYANPSETSPRLSLEQETLTKEDVILCRNTKPLVAMAYKLLRKGTACRVEGRSIGNGLIALCNRWKVTSTPALLNVMLEWRDKQVQKLLAQEKEQKAEMVNDQVETIQVLAEQLMREGKTKVADLTGFIRSLFGDTPEGQQPEVLTLSTIHKSKGREWKRVFILGRSKYMPSPWARKDWQMVQERNLMYVAVTRAISELIDVVED